ncbi:outer membrane lipoprotein-sorting protein [bacterium]|nr:outer membrane lipoprotein-sorting protein [bacterium]
MRKTAVCVFAALSVLYGQTPDGTDLLRKIDANMSSRNHVATSRMVIHGRRGSRTLEARSFTEGVDKSFTEYTAPSRDRGTKMLKLEDRLWIYSPHTDRIIQISGHMLRQSVMGSDLSYEDMMEDPNLERHYDAAVTGSDTVSGRDCWILTLKARTPDMAYASRILWVDRERFVPLKEELYAKSGKLLKRLDLSDVSRIEGRWYPKRMLFKDMLKEGEGTEFIVDEISFDQDIPEYLFTKAALRK